MAGGPQVVGGSRDVMPGVDNTMDALARFSVHTHWRIRNGRGLQPTAVLQRAD